VLGPHVSSLGEVGYAEWAGQALLIVLISLVVVYLLYRLLIWRFWTVERPEQVFRLRAPWWVAVVMTLLAGFLIIFFMMLANFQREGYVSDYLGPMLLFGLEGALCAVVIVWILSLISSPARCMFAPLLRRFFMRILGLAK
jgi:hypothetical protein